MCMLSLKRLKNISFLLFTFAFSSILQKSFTRLETVYSMYCGLVITVIHFISTILLLYGALTVITVYVAIRENDFVIKQGISSGRAIVTSWRPG